MHRLQDFIAPMHAKRDIVLPILSVRPSNAGIVSKQMDISSYFWLLVGAFSNFLNRSAVTKFQGETPSVEALNKGVEKFWKYRPLPRKRYEIGP